MENKSKTLQDVALHVKATKEAEDMFLFDIDCLIETNQDYLNGKIPETGTYKEKTAFVGMCLFELFLHTAIFRYRQDDINRCAILNMIHKEYACNLDSDYVEELTRKVQVYFDAFKLPKLNLEDSRDKQINDILQLPDDDEYKIRLYSILLEDAYNPLPEIEKYHHINAVLSDFYFNVTMPAEDEELRQRNKEINRVLINSNKNSIPDMSRVFEGKSYHGNSVAELIKDVGWIPKPSGKNSRIAQENRLRQFMDWSTKPDAKNRTITIIQTIYDEILSSVKPKLYESLIEIPLLYALYNAENETIMTTRKRFFNDIGIISPYFQRVPIQYYRDTLPETYIEDDSDITITRSVFYDAVYSKLREMLFSTLESLQKRKKIRYTTNTIVVISAKERINISELPPDEAIEIDKKILEANEYALKHTYYYEGRRKMPCNNWETVMKYRKNQEFKRVYENYISTQFGWSYTYEEIRITAGTKRSIEDSISEAQKKLRDTLINYLKQNSQTRYKNRNQRIQTEYQKLMQEVESTGLSVDTYKSNFNKLTLRIKPFPKFFIDIFEIMVDTEIDRNPEIEQQVIEWQQSHSKKAN